MKKFLCTILALFMAFSLFAPMANAEELKKEDFPQLEKADLKVMMNGEEKVANIYNLIQWDDDYEEAYSTYYIRLRDMAALLAGTDAKFDIAWDNKNKTLDLVIGKDYAKKDTDNVAKEATTKYTKVELALSLNGEKVEKPWDALIIDKEYYIQLGSLRKGLGEIYYTDLKDNEFIIYPTKTVYETTTVEGLKELYAKKDYTILFAWAPWCGWCGLEKAHLNEFLKADNNSQVISLIYDYKRYDDKMAHSKFELAEYPENYKYFAMDEAMIEYLKSLTGDDSVYFPTIFVMDKEGNVVLKYSNGENYSWVQLVEKAKNGEIAEIKAEREKIEKAYELLEKLKKEVNMENAKALKAAIDGLKDLGEEGWVHESVIGGEKFYLLNQLVGLTKDFTPEQKTELGIAEAQ